MRKVIAHPGHFELTKNLVIAAIVCLVLLGGVCYYVIQCCRYPTTSKYNSE